MTVAPETAAPVIATTWDLAESVLARKLPTYETRVHQQRLGRTVQHALVKGTNLAAQAGTGTGKSFTACIPGIQYALAQGETVVIATATIALQGQYTEKDLPFLATVLDREAVGSDWGYAELKGRGNYVCKSKLAEGAEFEGAAELAKFIEDNPEHSGDIARLPQGMVPGDQAYKVTTSSEECPGKSACNFGEECFATRAKVRAHNAQIIVVNHALLAIDLVLKQAQYDEETGRFLGYKHVVLPDHSRVIIDEAHNFAGYMTNMLGATLTEGTFNAIASEVAKFLDDNEIGRVLAGRTRAMFAFLRTAIGNRERTAKVTDEHLAQIEPMVATIMEELNRFETAMKAVQVRQDEKRSGRKARIRKKIENLASKLRVLVPGELGGDPILGDVVRWMEVDGDRMKVGYSPLSVAGFLRERLWSDTSGVLLSATLQPGGRADFIPGQLGLDEYEVFDAGTPFDYPNQAALFIPDDLNPKDRGSWSSGGHQLTMNAIKAANGRTLLLFTSRSEMEARYAALAEDLEDDGFPCYIQRKGESVERLVQRKRDEPTSVLFGLKSLMEGVSVEGDALRLVIIDKLPFPVPSEVVFEAQCDAVDAAVAKRQRCSLRDAKWKEDGSFYGLTVPTMSLLLEQAFGRLIRTQTDRGAVIIMDNRISPRRGPEGKPLAPQYGRRIYKALPPAQDLATERELRQFLKALARDDEE